jgi:hypothetical protein
MAVTDTPGISWPAESTARPLTTGFAKTRHNGHRVLATKITEVSFLVFLVRCSWRVGVTHGRRGGSMLAARHAFAPINIGIGETSAAFGGAVALSR